MLHRAHRFRFVILSVVSLGIVMGTAWPHQAQAQSQGKKSDKKSDKKSEKKKDNKAAAQQASLKLPPLKTPEDKLKFLEVIRDSMPTRKLTSTVSYTPSDLDKALTFELKLPADKYAKPISDERFVRRAYLDLTGTPPSAKVVTEFVQSSETRKRAKLVDELLDTDDYARRWARYWRNVIFFNSTAPRNKVNPQALEDWFAKEFKNNVPWDRMVSEMVSQTPKFNKAKKDDNNEWGQKYGPNNFVLAYDNDPTDIASHTARIFMGINIQCAECHDHPFDKWKREQFHELAAFFAPNKYYMPDKDDPSQKSEMHAQFLLGEKPPPGLKPDALRVAVAAYLIYNTDNYWFARAYVNRIWNELIGDGFYSVDSLGPDKESLHPIVLNRLASLFRYKNFDHKWLFRTIMNSETYQREIRTIDERDEFFSAVRPMRLNADEVAESIEHVAGDLGRLTRGVQKTFKQDPSKPQADQRGSMQQALLLMNNAPLQKQLKQSELRKKLVATKSNEQLMKDLYLGALARSPTEKEMTRGLSHLKKSGSREDAVDDLLWVLTNSAEFITKR
ncbi:MAG: DUF1549 domain-containing protein [Planctomycetales bacterium]|nr:DUF1549 domain-containing protein [Planctomycetales bacterium]